MNNANGVKNGCITDLKLSYFENRKHGLQLLKMILFIYFNNGYRTKTDTNLLKLRRQKNLTSVTEEIWKKNR